MENVTSPRTLPFWKFYIPFFLLISTSLTGFGQSVPVALDDAVTTLEDSVLVIDVQSNDTDPDGSALITAILSGPSEGFATVLNGDSISYTPGTSYFGTDSLQYTVCDGIDGCDTAWAYIEVQSVNDNPVAVDDYSSTAQNTSVAISVLLNDSDPENDGMSVSAVTQAAVNGSTSIVGTTVQYTPATSFNGLDSFQYQVCDTNGGCATAFVFIVVSGTNDAPIAADDITTLPEDTDIFIDVQANDTDPEGNSLFTFVLNQPPNGLVSVENFDSIKYDPLPDFYGTDMFEYAVCDGGGLCDTATVTINVTPVNDSVIANDDLATTPENTTGIFDVQFNDADADFDTLITVAIIQNPNHGIASILNNDSISYTPNNGYIGPDTLAYVACDQYMLCDSAIVVIDVTNTDDPPVAVDDSATTLEDTPVTIDVQANDFDPDGGPLVTIIVTAPTNGSVVTVNNDSVTYTPAPNFTGLDSFRYQVCDITSLCDQAWVYVTVLPVNDPPVAVDDFVLTPENTPIVIDVQANDSDPDGDPLTTGIVSTPANGTAVVLNGDSIDYTPNLGFIGYDTIHYQVCDPSSLCDTAIAVIRVDNLNFTPIANNDFVTTNEDVPVMIDVQANDVDPIGALLLTSITALPFNGTVSVSNLDSVLYTPGPNFIGLDTFYYSVCNPTVLCDSARVIVQVLPVNDAPVANTDTITVYEDSTEVILVQANDNDPDGNSLTTVVLNTFNGNAIVLNGDSISYTPNLNYNGPDSLLYEVCDNNGGCGNAWVYINVVPVNDPPVANDDNATTPEDTPITVDVQANDVDVDGDNLTTAIVSMPSNGLAVLVGDDINYAPAANFNGQDTIEYSICDPSGACDTAFVYIQVSPDNDCPIAVDDIVAINENTSEIIDVQSNDNNPDNSGLLTSIITSPLNGTTSLLNGDSIEYVPNQFFAGTDTLAYRVCDGTGCCDTAFVIVTITATDDAPIAANDFVTTPEETPVTVDVQANDFEPEGSAMVTAIVNGPANGTATVLSSVSINYVPGTDFNGMDTILYSVCDPVNCDTAMLVVEVLPLNDAPIANDDNVSTPEDTPITIDVQANDSDVDGTGLATSLSIAPANGSATVVNGDSIHYAPNANFTGLDSLQYQLCDDSSDCALAWAYITVTPVNDAPVALDDSITTPEDTPISINVQANDSDVDGDPLATTAILTGPSNGTASINGNNVDYAPALNYTGWDSLQYQICDGNGACDEAWAYILVTPVNDAPVALDDSTTTVEDTPVGIAVLTNDSDVDGGALSIAAILTAPANGNAAIAGTDVDYTPALNYNGWDSLQYQVCDGNGGCASAWAYILVTPVNDAPIAVDDSATTPEDTPITIDVQANDSDVESDPIITTAILTAPTNGSAALLGNDVTYTPAPNFNGWDSFEYQLCDNNGACTSAWVYVNVTPVNDAPTAVNDTVATPEDTPLNVLVQLNDVNPDGDPLTTQIISNFSNGVGTLAANSINYSPNLHYTGQDTLHYEICDGSGACDSAWIYLTVTPRNDGPVALDDSVTTPEEVAITIDVQANDSDVENDPLVTGITVNPANGTTLVSATGEVIYTPAIDFHGQDMFTYEVCDPFGDCAQAVVYVTVTNVNDLCIAEDDTVTTAEDVSIIVPVTDNDSDIDGDPLAIATIAAQPVHGTVNVLSNSEIEYMPNANYFGEDSLMYEVCDGNGSCDQATVYVSIREVSLQPVAVDDHAEVNQGNTTVVQVTLNDSDPEGQILTVTRLVDMPTKGTATIVPGDNIEYHAPLAATGTDVFSYEVCNVSGLCDSANVFITINGKIPIGIVIPQGISPNGDGSNDHFVIQGLNKYPDNKIVIFNRWGNEVFEQTSYTNDWAGQNMDGTLLPEGTYFYLLDIEEADVTYTGFIDLRRR